MLQEIEVIKIDNLLEADKKFVELHSVLNAMNILFGELQCLELDIEFDIEQLKNDFLSFFTGVEKDCEGHYRIIYNLAVQSASVLVCKPR